jgi:hypothetical protein
MNVGGALKKIALVTGANKGIGFEVARQFAASCCSVLLGARSRALGEEAAATLQRDGFDVRYISIDLDDPATIAAAAREIEADFGHLDILVNNAGIAILVNNAGIAAPGDGLPSNVSLDAIERDFRVNFLGSVTVTQAMLPLSPLHSGTRKEENRSQFIPRGGTSQWQKLRTTCAKSDQVTEIHRRRRKYAGNFEVCWKVRFSMEASVASNSSSIFAKSRWPARRAH